VRFKNVLATEEKRIAIYQKIIFLFPIIGYIENIITMVDAIFFGKN